MQCKWHYSNTYMASVTKDDQHCKQKKKGIKKQFNKEIIITMF